MKIDLSKNGLDSVWVPWEKTMIEILCEGGEYMSGPLTDKLNSRLGPEDQMSQASVIYFLKELQAWFIVETRPVLKKDGNLSKYESYFTRYSLEGLKEYLAILAENWAKEMRK